MARKPWTDQDIGYVVDSMDRSPREVAEHLGRTTRSVNSLRTKINKGWSPSKPAWTTDEDKVILENPQLTSPKLAEKLPGRTAQACNIRRQTLGVRMAGHYKQFEPAIIGNRALLARTCTGCGKLLHADWFGFNEQRKAWRTECRKCASDRGKRNFEKRTPEENSKRAMRYFHKAQAITIPRAYRSGEEYTTADHEILADPTKTALVKALVLQRTFGAVKGQITQHGYKSHKSLGDPERDIWIINNPNSDRAEEITKQLTGIFADQPLTQAERQQLWDWNE